MMTLLPYLYPGHGGARRGGQAAPRRHKARPAWLAASHRPPRRRAFSLIEVLLAIMILGLGVISIAALFPAGIAQQRQSIDDSIGDTVARNAIATIRMKLRPEHFGAIEQFGGVSPTIAGDWGWRRPAFYLTDTNFNSPAQGAITIPAGTISIFGESTSQNTSTDTEVIWNAAIWGNIFTSPPPEPFLITQRERYYPAQNSFGANDPEQPQYVWDCMFRRFQGRILVAIFVYRIGAVGSGGAPYIINPNPNDATVPPLPIWLDLTLPAVQANACGNGPWHPGGLDGDPDTLLDNALIEGVPGGIAYNPYDDRHAWQEPRQWILDQNNNVHRVTSQFRENLADPMEVELVRPVAALPDLSSNVYSIDAATGEMVSDIWYLPISARVDTNRNGTIESTETQTINITPIYVTVKEL